MSKKKAEKSGYNKTGYSKIEIILMLFLQSMKADVEDYCDLETVSDEHTFVTKTGAMITIIEYKGIKSLISGDAFSRQIGLMTSNMRNYVSVR